MSRLVLFPIVGLSALLFPFSVARADAMSDLSRRTYRLGVAALDAVDATPAQRRAVSGAARDLGARLAPLEDDVRTWVRSAHRVFVAEDVSREAVEAVRVDGVRLVDEVSTPAVDFVVEVADTLTVEQRRELVRLAGAHADRMLRP